MQKITLFLCCLCYGLLSGQTNLSVTGVTAGGLQNAILSAGGNLNQITNLTVSGTLDARDFLILRDNMPVLASIDLGATIIAAYNSNPANAIPQQAFFNTNNSVAKTSLTNFIFPSTITSIQLWAFTGCTGLTSLNIPDSVNFIDEQNFLNCTGLTSISLPNSLTSIANLLFHNCNNLTTINIPSSVISIGESAFTNCTSLNSITLPTGLTAINRSAFQGCTSLTSVTIPSLITTISYRAFYNCTGLTSVTMPSVVTIADEAFQNCNNLTSVVMPNINTISNFSFAYCPLLNNLVFPSTLTQIGSYAFANCSALTTVNIPSSVTSIAGFAFAECTSLTTVFIPSSVTSIGSFAFNNCSNLASITVDAVIPINLSSSPSVFYGVNTSTCILYVPCGSEVAYHSADKWQDFINITALNSTMAPTAGSLTTQIFSGTTAMLSDLTITGTNIKWYDSAVGGNLLPNNTILTDNTIYYATQTISNCESITRLPITTRKISEASQTFCSGANVTNLLSTPSIGAYPKWYSQASGGIALPNNEPLSSGTYYIEQELFENATITNDLGFPAGIAVQNDGKILVTESRFGFLLRFSNNLPTSNIESLANGFATPFGVAVEVDGKILLADTYNHMIKRLNTDGSISMILGNGFSFPSGIAVQTDGKIIVADTGNGAIKRMNADGSNIETLGSGFNYPGGVAVQTDGKILIADTRNNIIKRMNTDGSNIVTLGTGFNFPYGIALQNDGKILVADRNNNAIKRMNGDGTNIITLRNGLNWPQGVAVESDGTILYTDTYNGSLKKTKTIISNRVPVNVNIITTPDNTVSVSGGVLTANQTGATYQWYQCPNTILIGETNQNFIPSVAGDYKVEINVSGCTVTSNCIALNTLGSENYEITPKLIVYPNPSKGLFVIESETSGIITVYNLLGKTMKTESISIGLTKIDLNNCPNGMYLMNLTTKNNRSKTIKIVKQ